MGELNLHPPEHPRFPHNVDALQDPQRTPSDHERRILDVFMRYKTIPDFASLPTPLPEDVAEASRRVQSISAQSPDPLR
jgi:hypothetical protein